MRREQLYCEHDETKEAKGIDIGVDVDASGKHSFFLLRLHLLSSHTRRIKTLSYLAEVAEQHTLPVGCSRRFHGSLMRRNESRRARWQSKEKETRETAVKKRSKTKRKKKRRSSLFLFSTSRLKNRRAHANALSALLARFACS